MEKSIKKLIEKYRSQNNDLHAKLNYGTTNDRTHSVLVHQYNQNLDFIKALETILKEK